MVDHRSDQDSEIYDDDDDDHDDDEDDDDDSDVDHGDIAMMKSSARQNPARKTVSVPRPQNHALGGKRLARRQELRALYTVRKVREALVKSIAKSISNLRLYTLSFELTLRLASPMLLKTYGVNLAS